jgi:hypothetical protein
VVTPKEVPKVKDPGYKVKLTIGDAIVEIEGKESGVVKLVTALKDALTGSRRVSPLPGSLQLEGSRPTVIVTRPRMDIRSFFEEKNPSSDVEAAAVAAYYYQHLAPEGERQDFVDSALLQRAFQLARRPLPKRAIYTLQNARNAGYLDSRGDGQYRLNAVGYNLVEHGLGPSKEEGGLGPKKPVRRRRKKSPRQKKKGV